MTVTNFTSSVCVCVGGGLIPISILRPILTPINADILSFLTTRTPTIHHQRLASYEPLTALKKRKIPAISDIYLDDVMGSTDGRLLLM